MWVAARLVLAFVLLAASGVPTVAAVRSGAARAVDPVRKRASAPADPSTILLQLQVTIGKMAISDEPVPNDIRNMTRALTLAKGRTLSESALLTLSGTFAAAVARGSFDDETIERMAQNLYATVNGRELTSREAGLVIADISSLLKEAGAEAPAIDAVVAALRAICPAPPDRTDAAGARSGGLLILTRP